MSEPPLAPRPKFLNMKSLILREPLNPINPNFTGNPLASVVMGRLLLKLLAVGNTPGSGMSTGKDKLGLGVHGSGSRV